MKFILLLIALSLSLAAEAADDSLASTLSGKQNAYFRVVLEKPNGVDMRANVMPKEIIDMLEKQGKAVRPSRTSANVGYWCFFKGGDFATCEIINNPSMADLSYAKLEEVFAGAPHDGTKWKKKEDTLTVGGRDYLIRLLDADDDTTGGKKGEVEIAVIKDKKKVYFYFGSLLEKRG
jgi:hypothetical protein